MKLAKEIVIANMSEYEIAEICSAEKSLLTYFIGISTINDENFRGIKEYIFKERKLAKMFYPYSACYCNHKFPSFRFRNT